MRLTEPTCRNRGHVNQKPVDLIVIFDETGALLEVRRGWLTAHSSPKAAGYASHNVINSIEEITEVRGRREVDWSREEHFMVSAKGVRTLYLCAKLFRGYTAVVETPWFENAATVSMMHTMSIRMSINGKPADWVTISAGHAHRDVDKATAPAIRAVQAAYNSAMSGYSTCITETQALILIKMLPELNELAKDAL